MSDEPQKLNVAALTSLDDLITDLLSGNHKEIDIWNAIQDINLRFAWQCGSRCHVFSRKLQKWTDGEIIDIVIDNTKHKEWLTVKYVYGQKALQRFSSTLKPIEFHNEYQCNEVIIQSILKKVNGSKRGNNETSTSSVFIFNHYPYLQRVHQSENAFISSLNIL